MVFYKEYKPTKKLDKYIECYWVLKDSAPDNQIVQQRLVPGGRAEIIFTNSVFWWFGANKLNKPIRYSKSFLLGQRTSAMYIGLAGNYHFIGIRFKHGCQSLFKISPANNYTNKLTHLNDLYGTSGKMLSKTVLSSKNIDTTIQYIEKWILSNLTGTSDDWQQVQHFIDKITSDNFKNTPIQKLSKQYGWQYKKIERTFLKHTGYTPKNFMKLIRFKKVLEEKNVASQSLTEKAYTFGFYDQSHFIREFYNYVGDKPSAFYKKPSVLTNLLYQKKEQ